MATETMQANAAGFTLTPAQLTHLQSQRRQAAEPGKADGYLAVMLVGNAGWSPGQAATFLGIEPTSLAPWVDNFRQGGIDSLRTCPAVKYTGGGR